jgi:hypothetical protein
MPYILQLNGASQRRCHEKLKLVTVIASKAKQKKLFADQTRLLIKKL